MYICIITLITLYIYTQASVVFKQAAVTPRPDPNTYSHAHNNPRDQHNYSNSSFRSANSVRGHSQSVVSSNTYNNHLYNPNNPGRDHGEASAIDENQNHSHVNRNRNNSGSTGWSRGSGGSSRGRSRGRGSRRGGFGHVRGRGRGPGKKQSRISSFFNKKT